MYKNHCDITEYIKRERIVGAGLQLTKSSGTIILNRTRIGSCSPPEYIGRKMEAMLTGTDTLYEVGADIYIGT